MAEELELFKPGSTDPLLLGIGDTFGPYELTLEDLVDDTFDWTGIVVVAQIKDKDGNLVASPDVTIDTTTPPYAYITIGLDYADTESIEPGEYNFDVRYTLSGVRRTIFQSQVNVFSTFSEFP